MKKIITLIMCVAFSATMFGQTAKVEERVKALEGDARTLKGQVETLQGQIATMQSRLNELADRNAEYKKPNMASFQPPETVRPAMSKLH